jgi:hypothetical protein
METLDTTQLETEESWESLNEQLFLQRGIFHGLPLGIFEVEIVTSSKMLKDLVTKLGQANALHYRDEDGAKDELEVPENIEVVNMWQTRRSWKGMHGMVLVLRNTDTGKSFKVFKPSLSPDRQRFDMWLDTGGIRSRYSLAEAERVARKRLEEALSPQQQDCYLVNDAFAEHGKSGIMYILRKSRPTIAMRINPDGSGTPICALCLHPLGYYKGTWAGVMPPSDEVLSHLLMIRGNEYLLWKKANHISFDQPNSGI